MYNKWTEQGAQDCQTFSINHHSNKTEGSVLSSQSERLASGKFHDRMRVAHKTHKSCTQKEEWAVGRSLCRMFMRLCKVKNSSNSSVCVCCSAHQCYRQTDAMWSLQRFRPKSSISATTSIGIAGMGEMNFCKLRAFNYIWQLKLNLSQSAEIWNTYL